MLNKHKKQKGEEKKASQLEIWGPKEIGTQQWIPWAFLHFIYPRLSAREATNPETPTNGSRQQNALRKASFL